MRLPPLTVHVYLPRAELSRCRAKGLPLLFPLSALIAVVLFRWMGCIG